MSSKAVSGGQRIISARQFLAAQRSLFRKLVRNLLGVGTPRRRQVLREPLHLCQVNRFGPLAHLTSVLSCTSRIQQPTHDDTNGTV